MSVHTPGFQIVSALAPQPSEVIFAKITMSAFEGTPLQIALRDCGVTAFAIAGIALEVGIEPTIRHAIELGLIPVLIGDACGSGNPAAARRSLETLAYEGNTVITDVATFTSLITQPGGKGA
jgi:nicotinamidase-related amidase